MNKLGRLLGLFTVALLACYVGASSKRESSASSSGKSQEHYHRHSSPVIKTHAGPIRGRLVDVASPIDVYEFKGIPYAEAPVGHRRFEKPVRKHRWHHVFQADRDPHICPHTLFPGRDDIDRTTRYWTHRYDQMHFSEDCLTLSIWAPKQVVDEEFHRFVDNTTQEAARRKEGKDKKKLSKEVIDDNEKSLSADSNESIRKHNERHHKHLSILAYFVQGGYGGGNVTAFDGAILAAHQNIIVVTIQYRVGLLGFAYGQGIHGNMGLWDQLLALRWIHRNIHHFGGSKHHVTIAGQGAAAAHVSLHLLSHHGRKYYRRAIIQSTTAISHVMGVLTPHEAHNLTDTYFNFIASQYCPSQRHDMSCLKHLPTRVFIQALNEADVPGNRLPIMPAVIDGHFLRHDPALMIRHGRFHRVPLLIGVNRDEGSQFAAAVPEVVKFLPTRDYDARPVAFLGLNQYEKLTRAIFKFYKGQILPLDETTFEAVRLRYWPKTADNGYPSGNDIGVAISSMTGDSLLTCPTLRWAELIAHDVHRVYVYHFNHFRASSYVSSSFPWMGVTHGAELPFIFGEPLSPKAQWFDYDETDAAISHVMMGYWANFVKHGDPNGKHNDERLLPHGDIVKDLRFWPRLHGGQECKRRYFEISAPSVIAKTDEPIICRFKEDDCLFWRKYLPRLGFLRQDVDNRNQ